VISKFLRLAAVAVAALAACIAVALPAVSASASVTAHAHQAARHAAATGSNCHNPVQISSFVLPDLSWYWNGTDVVESTGYTVLCQIAGTYDGTPVEQYRLQGTSTCATRAGTTSIVGDPCNTGRIAADWVVTGPDDTYQYTIFGGTAEAAQGNGDGTTSRSSPRARAATKAGASASHPVTADLGSRCQLTVAAGKRSGTGRAGGRRCDCLCEACLLAL
jgi:hypothetical protein